MSAEKAMVIDRFNYESLDPETRSELIARTQEIHALVRRTARNVVQIGRKLAAIRERLGDQFVSWLNLEFAWSERAAYNFISVWKQFGDQEMIDQIAPSALYLLAAPSTPLEVKQSVVKLVKQGQRVTHKAVKGLIRDLKDHAPADVHIYRASEDPEQSPAIAPVAETPLQRVNKLIIAIENKRLDYSAGRISYALHNLADLIKEKVPRHPGGR